MPTRPLTHYSCRKRIHPNPCHICAEYYRGNISASGKNVCSCTVEDTVCSIDQTLAAMGSKDPRINSKKELDIRLKLQYRAYSKQDTPPNCVKPVPVEALRHIASIAAASANKELKSISDMIQLTYFFLLRPGEYMGTKSPTTPFQLK